MGLLTDLYKKPKTNDVHGVAIGNSGTIDEGFEVSAEAKPQLRGREGSLTYEKMSFDSQIGMILNAVKTPILSADWDFLNEGQEDTNNIHTQFCRDYFFKNYPLPFNNLLNQMLSMTEYGFSLFEQVYKIWNFNGTMYTVPELQARLQTSIEEIQPDNQIVQQRMTDGQQADIPFDVLVFFVLNQEGNDLRGTSLLRWSYWDWKRKTETEVIDTIGVRKNALGIPVMTIPKSVPPGSKDYEDVQAILNRIGRSQNPHMIKYPDYIFEWIFPNYNNAITAQKIARHNTQMAKSTLTQFLELGQGGKGGSFALGDVQSQVFLNSLQYIIDLLSTVFNRQVIKPMIDINFGEQEFYPKLIGLNVNKGKVQQFITNYGLMLEKGAIKTNDRDEDFIRTKMEMRNLTEEDLAERAEQKEVAPLPPEPLEDKSKLSEKSTKLKLAEKPVTEKRKQRNEFVDFNQPLLTDFMQANLTLMKDKLLADLEKILERGELAQRGLNSLELPLVNKYKEGLGKKIGYFNSSGFKQAKKDASGHTTKLKLSEIPDVNPKNLPDPLKVYAKNMSSNTVDSQTTTMKVRAVFVAQNKMDKGFTVKQSISAANEQLDKFINSGNIGTTASFLINDGSNMGFMEFGKENPDIIQAYQYVAVDDSKTTDICRWLNGHIYSVGSIQLSQVRPPLHFGCRSFMDAIYADEPKVTPDNELPPPSIWNTRSF